MKIIGHRGARGLKMENTLDSFALAIELGVDTVEFDVWTTKDGVPVVHHDKSLYRLSGVAKQIPEITFQELRQIRLNDGQEIPTAEEVLELIGDTPFYLEIKDPALTKPVLELLRKNQRKDLVVTSFEWPALLELQNELPDMRLLAAKRGWPMPAVTFAHQNNFYGLTLNFWFFNHLIYLAARHYKLDINLYAVNSRFLVKVYRLFGFKLNIYTDYPDRFVEP